MPRLVLALITVAVALRAALFALSGIELHYDEAQYWEWSRKLDWGYYSKGPLIAWLIAASEGLFGHGVWQTRLPAWLISGLFMGVLYRCTLDIWQDERSARWAVVLALFCPMYFLLGGVMTTDIILFLFYTWGIWAVYCALERERPSAWVQFGLATGLGCLTKLSMLLLPFAVFIVMLAMARYRRQFLHPQPWYAAVITLLIVSPMLWWNMQHDWVSIRHELGHVQSARETSLSALIFLAEQLIAYLPLVVVAVAALITKINYKKGESDNLSKYTLLFGLAAVCFVFFLLKSVSGKVQINWPAPVYLSALMALSGIIPRLSTKAKRALIASLILMGGVIGIAFFPELVGMPYKAAAFKEMRLWSSPVKQVFAQTQDVDFIITDSYKLAGELAFYWPQPIPVYIAGHAGRRFNQHDLWPGLEREVNKNGLYIDKTNADPATLKQAFTSCAPSQAIAAVAADGSRIRTLYVRQCRQYHPVAWPEPKGY